jgi:pilus assembly protein FimV
VTAPRPPAVPAPVAEEPSLIDSLSENPLVLPAAGGLLALLAGFGLWRMRQRKAASNVDSSFLESRLQPDSFFGSSGGQRIDTAEAMASGSSMVYSPSQLDAAGDVDPVAEADVYLAYGRDLQAEEILKEAMRSTPTRVAIHTKLLEIYAKRRDARAFEVVASEAFGLTQGQGAEWERACELGRELDPANPLYQPGGHPAPKPGAPTTPGGLQTMPFGPSTVNLAGPATGAGELDLDLDFALDDADAPAKPAAPVSNLDDLASTEALTTPQASAPAAMDFDLDLPDDSGAGSNERAETAPVTLEVPGLDLGAPEPVAAPSFDLDLGSAAPAAPAVDTSAPVSGMMDFNLGDLNLDLNGDKPKEEVTAAPTPAELSEENPLETKLSLAEEFRAIGDFEGARSLAEEVLAEASGPLKTKASTFLADLA